MEQRRGLNEMAGRQRDAGDDGAERRGDRLLPERPRRVARSRRARQDHRPRRAGRGPGGGPPAGASPGPRRPWPWPEALPQEEGILSRRAVRLLSLLNRRAPPATLFPPLLLLAGQVPTADVVGDTGSPAYRVDGGPAG